MMALALALLVAVPGAAGGLEAGRTAATGPAESPGAAGGAGGEPRDRQGDEAPCRQADEEEGAGAFAEALAHHRSCAEAAPGTRRAARASERVGWLLARAEGAFAPLARLERVRRDPALADDPAAIDALARDSETFPAGLVRVEARLFIAEAWLGRMHRPGDAVPELRRITADPAADPLTARLAEREIVDALTASGELAAAAREARAHAGELDPSLVRAASALARRRWLRSAALGVVAAFAALATAALVAARRRRDLGAARLALRTMFPAALGFAVFLGLAGGTLASRYESGNALPFLVLGAAVLPLVLVGRAWAAVGSARPAARAARAVLCAGCVMATAFIVLEAVNPSYLEGFGL